MSIFKEYERVYDQRLSTPAFARLDGKNFSKFTKNMDRPYDERMSMCMRQTAWNLAKEFNVDLTYTQSDEITLTWGKFIPFDGRVLKLTSLLSAKCTLLFNQYVSKLLPEFIKRNPTFDCRVFSVKSEEEGVDCFLWREEDCRKNSITMLAQEYFSHKELFEKSSSDKLNMLLEKEIIWSEQPEFFKYGVYIKKTKVLIPFTSKEIGKLPEKHEARKNPELLFERQIFENIKPLSKQDNKEEIVYGTV